MAKPKLMSYPVLVIMCFMCAAMPGRAQMSPFFEEGAGAAASSAESTGTGSSFLLGRETIPPAASSPANPSKTSRFMGFECSPDVFSLLPGCESEFPSVQQENTGSANGSPAPAVKPQSQRHHRPHLIELTAKNWRPLKPHEKFGLVWHDLTGWETHISLGVDAAISFATDDRNYLGDGFQGFARRYGINVLNEANFTLMEVFIYPTVFHTDPRYIPMENGAKGRRLAYALSRVVVARKDSGGSTFNAAKILGAFTASAISDAYNSNPAREPNLTVTVTRAAISIGSDAAFNIFKEFWPDFARKVKLNVWIQNIVRSTIRDKIRVD